MSTPEDGWVVSRQRRDGKTIAEFEAEGVRWIDYDPDRPVEVLGDDGHWRPGWMRHWHYNPREGWCGYVSSPSSPGFGTTHQYVPAERLRPAEASPPR